MSRRNCSEKHQVTNIILIRSLCQSYQGETVLRNIKLQTKVWFALLVKVTSGRNCSEKYHITNKYLILVKVMSGRNCCEEHLTTNKCLIRSPCQGHIRAKLFWGTSNYKQMSNLLSLSRSYRGETFQRNSEPGKQVYSVFMSHTFREDWENEVESTKRHNWVKSSWQQESIQNYILTLSRFKGDVLC